MGKEDRGNRWTPEPRGWTSKSIRVECHLVEAILGEIEVVAEVMDDFKFQELVVPSGAGSQSHDRALRALNAWHKGLRNALHAAVRATGKSVTGLVPETAKGDVKSTSDCERLSPSPKDDNSTQDHAKQ